MGRSELKKAESRREAREKRQRRVRSKLVGTDKVPRLCVFRSIRYTYAQFVSDESQKVLGGTSTRSVRAEGKSAASVESAKALGKKIAQMAEERRFEQVIFDRNGYIYHGRIAAVAEGAREGGLKL